MTKTPKLDELSVSAFSTELSSASPAPGGGSTAALAGALACGLISMVAKITLNKLEDTTDNKELKKKLKDIAASSNNTRAGLLELITDDTEAFNDIMNSFKLPKTTADEKERRHLAIQTATKHAAEVPLKTAELAFQALTNAAELTHIGTTAAITDTGVAGAMAYSAVTGAVWNVKINLGSIRDENFITDMDKKIANITMSAKTLWQEIRENVGKEL